MVQSSGTPLRIVPSRWSGSHLKSDWYRVDRPSADGVQSGERGEVDLRLRHIPGRSASYWDRDTWIHSLPRQSSIAADDTPSPLLIQAYSLEPTLERQINPTSPCLLQVPLVLGQASSSSSGSAHGVEVEEREERVFRKSVEVKEPMSSIPTIPDNRSVSAKVTAVFCELLSRSQMNSIIRTWLMLTSLLSFFPFALGRYRSRNQFVQFTPP